MTMYATNTDYSRPKKLIIGENYHIEGLNRGCVFRLIEVNGEKARFETPKYRKEYYFSTKRILNVKRNNKN